MSSQLTGNTPTNNVQAPHAAGGAPRASAANAAANAAHASGGAELSALFAVVGTPAWSCINAVQSEPWRNYLRRIPGRCGGS